MLLSKITLPGLFFTQITDKLCLDKSSYKEEKLMKEINDNNNCSILNPLVDILKINENLKSSPFIINNILISKIYLSFNTNNLDSSINIENVTIDLIKNNNIVSKKKNEIDEKNIFNIGMLSKDLINLVISVKSIKIRILEGNNNSILYSLFINEINYQRDSNEIQLGENEKNNYLFCNNKIINIGGCVLKEGYNENDEIFFNNDDKCNKVNFYTNPQILIVIYNKIHININHDYQNQKLIINNINYDDLFIECIMNMTQIKNLIKFYKTFSVNVNINNNQIEEQDELNDNKNNEFDLLSFKIKTLDININFKYCYFIFLKNDTNINKFWMFYQNYFDKYYTMNIEQKKNSDISKKYNTNNILNLMQKHFCYFSKEYYLIYINQPKLSIKNDDSVISFSMSTFLSRLIQPNNVPEKINVIIIDNKSNNNESYIDNEQAFNNLFIPYYKKVIQYGYYTHNILNISNLEMKNNEIAFNDIDFEINALVLFNIMMYYKTLFNIGNEQIKNNINENEEKIEKSHEFNFLIKGNRINLNLMINKKWIDYIKDKKLNNCFDSHFYAEKILISLETIKFNINNNYQKLFLNLTYKKLYAFFIMKTIIYPLLYIINIKNKISNSGKQIDNSIIISKINNNNVDSNYKYIINLDEVFSFVNPILLTYYLIQYIKIFIYTFDIFKHNKNKKKSKKSLNDIEENLNIDFIAALNEYENNKFTNIFFKWFSYLIKNTDISIENLNFIFFCHLSISNVKFDIKTLYEKNEYLFKLIFGPILTLKLKECSYKNNKIKMNNILLFAKTKIENIYREDLIYKEIIGDLDIKSDNYDFIIYKSKTKNIILQGEIKVEEKKKTIKIELNIDDIVFCPILNKFNDIVMIIEKNIIKYQKMNSYLFNCYPFINEKTDLINYEKMIKNIHFYQEDNQKNDIIFKIKAKCTKFYLDLYSTNKNKMLYDKNFFENIIEKNKMRLLLEFEQISVEYIYNQKISLSLQKVNSAFLKDLRISNTSYSLLIDEYSIINYTSVNESNENSSNSLYFLNVKENNKNNNINQNYALNRSKKFSSIIANNGFVPIIECENGITINIILSNNNRNINNIIINTKNEIIINGINIKICKDSLKDIIYFIQRIPHDIQTISNLKSAFKDDVEKIIIEKDTLSNNLKDQLKNIDDYSESSSIEFHSVKLDQKDYKNNMMYNRLLKYTNNVNQDQASTNSNNKIEENNIINNNKIYENNNKNKNKKKNYKMNLQINSINIFLYDGEDFNFQGNHMLVVFYNSACTQENRSNQDTIIKQNERNINNYILISIKELKCKYSLKITDIEMNISLKSLIIEDNIEKSIYKKLLSHYDFQNEENIFFNSKIKIIKEKNGNDNYDIDATIDITPIAIYLDKETFDFLFIFFTVLKKIIYNENDEDNEDEPMDYNESNRRINNRIIQNNDDIMNINNEDHNSSNNDILGDQEISTINQFQNDNIFKSYLNPDKLYINSLVINPFFISFNYNPGKQNYSEEEIETTFKTNDFNMKYIKYLDYLKNISLNELILNFKKYDNNEENKQIKIKYIFKELFNYYYDDIIDYKSFNSYVKALPVVNKFCSVYEGFFNIWNKTIDHEKDNRTLEEGFVVGTQELVVNTTCSILSVGETITDYLSKVLNINRDENNNETIIKKMKRKINENLCKKEDYYFK